MSFSFFSTFDFTFQPAIFTPWSLVHFITGVAFKSLSISSENARLIHTLYELKDLYISYYKKQNLNPILNETGIQNSFLNSIGDQISFELGFNSGAREKKLRDIFLLYLLAFAIISAPTVTNKGWNILNRG